MVYLKTLHFYLYYDASSWYLSIQLFSSNNYLLMSIVELNALLITSTCTIFELNDTNKQVEGFYNLRSSHLHSCCCFESVRASCTVWTTACVVSVPFPAIDCSKGTSCRERRPRLQKGRVARCALEFLRFTVALDRQSVWILNRTARTDHLTTRKPWHTQCNL